jgi:hypothetical protein
MMSVYERDFYAWTQQQAALLQDRDFAHLDIDNLIEEIEAMGRSERRQLTNRLEILLIHLLKWPYQPELRGRSWQLTIIEQRRRIAKLLRANPSLRPHLPDLLVEAYEDAAFGAMRETGLPQESFPAECPFALAQVLAQDWLPG